MLRFKPTAHAGPLDRGATVVEYSLVVALVLVFSMGALKSLQDQTGDEVGERAAVIGDPGNIVPTTTTAPDSTTVPDGGEEEEDPVAATAAGSGAAFKQVGSGNKWRAEVTFAVTDVEGEPVSGVTIIGSWNPAPPGGDSLSTVECVVQAGSCKLYRWDLPNGAPTATFTTLEVVSGTAYTIALPPPVVVSKPI